MMNIYKLKQIETKRLIIRPIQLCDSDELVTVVNRSREALRRWMPWANDNNPVATAIFVEQRVKAWMNKNTNEFTMVAINKADQAILMATGFNEKSDLSIPFFEIGYWIDVKYQGHGFVTETVQALTQFALNDLNAKHVQICTQAENIKSIAVAKRCGYLFKKTIAGDRVNAESGLAADSILLVATDIKGSPGVKVCWHDKEGRKNNV